MTALGRAITDALAYHGLFDFPMTAQEIRLALSRGTDASQHAVLLELDALRRLGRVSERDGLWHPVGRDATVALRKERYDIAEGKFRIARRFFRIARHAPFLRAAFVCNTLARSNARIESDIDLFIVTAPGRIWITRFFVTGLAKLLGARPTPSVSRDKLCLSFFSTEDALDLRHHAIENDVYLPHWLLDLYPIHDEAGITGKLFAENTWARERIQGLRRQDGSARRTVAARKGFMKKWTERVLGWDAFEHFSKAVQLRVMPRALKEGAEQGSGVVVSDTTLKLHALDRREEIRDRFNAAVDEIGRAADDVRQDFQASQAEPLHAEKKRTSEYARAV